jgi:hypothetical protein
VFGLIGVWLGDGMPAIPFFTVNFRPFLLLVKRFHGFSPKSFEMRQVVACRFTNDTMHSQEACPPIGRGELHLQFRKAGGEC